MNVIEAEQVEKSFGLNRVLRGVDMKIAEGSIYGLLGRNGAGKTTLLRIMIGLAHADAGETRVLGQNLVRGCPPEKADVAYVAQGEFLPPWARIEDVIAFDRALRPRWDDTALRAWLADHGLVETRKISRMSVGERKRLELELALAGRPKVLLLDEPFAGLDPVSRAEFVGALIDHAAAAGATIVLSSHIIADLERLCDRIGIMARGIVAFEDSMEALKERGASLEEASVELMRTLEKERADA